MKIVRRGLPASPGSTFDFGPARSVSSVSTAPFGRAAGFAEVGAVVGALVAVAAFLRGGLILFAICVRSNRRTPASLPRTTGERSPVAVRKRDERTSAAALRHQGTRLQS